MKARRLLQNIHQWRKGFLFWKKNGTLFISVPFTWHIPKVKLFVYEYRQAFPSDKIVAGGPAVKLLGAPWADETLDAPPGGKEVVRMFNPSATFTSRGCVRKCKFCAVPKIEGAFRELKEWRAAPVICDNNVFVASKKHFKKVIKSLLQFPMCDFNQGLDARLFTRWHARQLCRLKHPIIRFAFDDVRTEGRFVDAIKLARRVGLRGDFPTYVLIGFNDTPEDALYRLEKCHSLRVRPFPMRYQPLGALRKNMYILPGWTSKQFHDMTWYYSPPHLFQSAGYSFEQYVEMGGVAKERELLSEKGYTYRRIKEEFHASQKSPRRR